MKKPVSLTPALEAKLAALRARCDYAHGRVMSGYAPWPGNEAERGVWRVIRRSAFRLQMLHLDATAPTFASVTGGM